MPDDRLFHKKLGRGQKPSSLTDFEFRVWTQCLLSADDYGVMLRSVAPLQSDNVRLAREKPRTIIKAIDKLVEVGLLLPFEHQGLPYVCQPKWDDFQKVRYPRDAHQPCPPLDVIARCSKKTQDFLATHPRNANAPITGTLPEDSGNISETDRSLPCAPAHETANGLRQEANGQRPTSVAPFRKPRSMGAGGSSPAQHIGHARCNDRGVCIPQSLYTELLGRFANDVGRFNAFYEGILAQMPDDFVPVGSVFKFWQDMLAKAFPDLTPKVSAREAAMKADW